MGVTVHVVDSARAGDGERFDQLSTKHSGDVIIRLSYMCNGIMQVATDVLKQTKPKSIDLLIIYGHGTEMFQAVSMGDGREEGGEGGLTGYKENALIGPEQLGFGTDDQKAAAFAAAWRPLRSQFSEKGRVVLKGCHTAGGGPQKGQEFIKRLSKLLGVPVLASDRAQSVGRSDLVGNILTARPSGSVTEDGAEGRANLDKLPFVERVLIKMFGQPR
jgi:hypothetical protein